MLTKFAHVESRFSGRKRQREEVFYTPVILCDRRPCSTSVAVGLEGSCQEAIPLPSTTFGIFSVAFHSAHFPPDWLSQTHPCFHSRGVGSVRRTSHPSGSRPLDVSLLRQTSAPGIVDAPENPRFPAVSNRVQRTDSMAPSRVQLLQGSRQRRRLTRPFGGRPSVMG